MRRIRWLEVGLIISTTALPTQLLPYFVRALRDWPQQGKQTSGHALVPNGDASTRDIKYLIYLPQDYSKQKRCPLLLFLHGSGQGGEDIERVAKCGPPYSVAQGKQFPMMIVSPQCHEDEVWQPGQVLALLEHLEKKYSIDSERIYASGYSMGGHGTWSLASTAPGRFAAAVPVAGGGDAANASRLLELPIWAFHGARDDVIPLEGSQRMVEAIQAKGGNARLTILDDNAHDICNLVFSATTSTSGCSGNGVDRIDL